MKYVWVKKYSWFLNHDNAYELRNTLDSLIMNVNEKCSWFLIWYANELRNTLNSLIIENAYEYELRNTLDSLIMNVNELRNALDFSDDMQMS